MKVSFERDALALKRAEWLLLILTFSTAMVDVFTFSQLGVFVANQTGNIIFLSLGTVGITSDTFHPSRSIVALLSFWLGSFMSGRLSLVFGGRQRIYLFFTFLFQALLILLVSILILTSAIDVQPPESSLQLIVVFPLAIVFGTQAAVARAFGVPAITTVVVTTAMVDLFNDPNLFVAPFSSKAKGRNDRIIFIVVFYLGGLAGGGMVQGMDAGWTLVFSALIKFSVAGSMLLLEGDGGAEERKRIEERKKQVTMEDDGRSGSRNALQVMVAPLSEREDQVGHVGSMAMEGAIEVGGSILPLSDLDSSRSSTVRRPEARME